LYVEDDVTSREHTFEFLETIFDNIIDGEVLEYMAI